MLNIKDLETRHTKYKIKSYIPYIFISLIIISGLFISLNISTKTTDTKKIVISKPIQKAVIKKIELNTSKKQEIIVVKKELPKQNIKKEVLKKEKITKDKKIILTPSLDFMRRINTPVEIYNNEKKTYVKKKNLIKTPIIKKEKKETLKIEKKSSINIRRNKDQEDLKHVIKRFKTNNNPALSLFIAKKYYQLGNYHKSYNYALITNQLNNNIESSWIIFSKSLVKLHKKKMAINTLKKYIDNSHSPRAKILLDEIQSGKFK